MKKVLIDINPMGQVEDLHVEENEATRFFAEALRESNQTIRLVSDDGNFVEVLVASTLFTLKVRRAIGGNQWNVWQNLKVLQPERVEAGEIQTHFGFRQEFTPRKVMYVPGMRHKVDLMDPKSAGDLVFYRNLEDTLLFLSSSPIGEIGKMYWEKLREALENTPGLEIIWNPGSKQVSPGGLSKETLAALKGKVRLLQVNTKEAEALVRQHLHPDGNPDRLPEFVESAWTVVTKGAEGIRGYADGKIYDEAAVNDTRIVEKFLGTEYCESNDIGCGDAVMATLISHLEEDLDIALKIANTIGKIQYHHHGSNLSSVKGFQI